MTTQMTKISPTAKTPSGLVQWLRPKQPESVSVRPAGHINMRAEAKMAIPKTAKAHV